MGSSIGEKATRSLTCGILLVNEEANAKFPGLAIDGFVHTGQTTK